jgi:pilus assembly protein CpaB
VTAGRRRRRAVALLGAALACGGLAASQVRTRASEVEAEVGPLVPVVVARVPVPAGGRLAAAELAVRQVPERFAPSDALTAPAEAVGQRVAGALAAGGYVTAGGLTVAGPSAQGGDGGAGRDGGPIRGGERRVEVAVAGGEALAAAQPGTRVDVLVTTEPRGGAAAGGRTYLALQDVELLAARPAGDAGGAGASSGAAAHATTIATLRVTLREAVFLTAAESFAREIRLLPRAPGDRRTARPLEVDAGGL